jgi:hypothetical protein
MCLFFSFLFHPCPMLGNHKFLILTNTTLSVTCISHKFPFYIKYFTNLFTSMWVLRNIFKWQNERWKPIWSNCFNICRQRVRKATETPVSPARTSTKDQKKNLPNAYR